MSRQHNAPAALATGMNADIRWIEGWMGPRAGLNVLEKRKSVVFAGIRTSDLPAQSLVAIPALLFRLPQRFNNLFHLRGLMLRNPDVHRERFRYHVTLRYLTVLHANWWTALHKLSFVAGKITSHFLHKQTEIGASLSTDPRLKTSKVFFFINSVVFEAVTQNERWRT
jgi:hypothetical protein